MPNQPLAPGGHGSQLRRPVPPASVLTAVKLMYVGAGVSAVATLVTISSLNSGIVTANHSATGQANPGLTTGGLYTAEFPSLVAVVVLGLITVGLWIWMARANRAGNRWARITAIVFFGLNTLMLRFALGESLSSLLISVLDWLVGLGAIVLLWRRQSSEYFGARSSEVQP
jgi:hypothetical protein